MKGIVIVAPEQLDSVYGGSIMDRVKSQVDILSITNRDAYHRLDQVASEVEVIISSWGMPQMNKDFLKFFPALKAVFYGAGSIKGFITDEAWDRGIRVTSAYAANADPVCEFTVSQIIFCLKKGWQNALYIHDHSQYPSTRMVGPGNYQTTVGLVSLGQIGRKVAKMLAHFEYRVLAYDPYLQPEAAREIGVEPCGLDELFHESDVISCHTPKLPETEKMLKGHHFESMKKDASFINTSRGAVVDEAEFCAVFSERKDLFALLDVTYNEPPPENSFLYSLPNVVLTPHIAGSVGMECRRMGNLIADEIARYLAGEPMQCEITREASAIMA